MLRNVHMRPGWTADLADGAVGTMQLAVKCTMLVYPSGGCDRLQSTWTLHAPL